MVFDDYKIRDFQIALQKFKNTYIDLDYDSFVRIASELVTADLMEDLGLFRFEDSILAAFANGLVIGMLTAEHKYKPRDIPPLIKH